MGDIDDPPSFDDRNTLKSICGRHCKEDCANFFNKANKNASTKLMVDFNLRLQDFKNQLLSHLKIQERVGIVRYGICLDGHLYCPQAFSHISGRSIYLIQKVLRDHREGTCRYIHANERRILPRVTINFITWLRIFVGKYAQDDAEVQVKVLPSYLYKGIYIYLCRVIYNKSSHQESFIEFIVKRLWRHFLYSNLKS